MKALDFDDHGWTETLRQTRRMGDMIRKHSEIMDRFDPAKRVSLLIDEWGTWYDVEEGTNPGFLYQQNSVRDAVVAALNFNIFHRHGDRVRMANIAQMVNVLQSPILTDGARMITTPTYHAFDLYTDHMDAEYLDTPRGAFGAFTDATASVKDGAITVSATNTALDRSVDVEFELPERVTEVLRAQVLASNAPTAHNTFERPDDVKLVDLDVTVDGGRVRYTLPPHSVSTVRLGQG